jgi:hypothetical protein
MPFVVELDRSWITVGGADRRVVVNASDPVRQSGIPTFGQMIF